MPLANIIQSIRPYFLNIYPELARFRKLAGATASTISLPQIDPKLKKFLRYFIPVATVSIILIIGLLIGNFIIAFFRPAPIVPPQVVVTTPTPAPSYISPFTQIRTSIANFTPDLPDPVPPVFDQRISLETLPD